MTKTAELQDLKAVWLDLRTRVDQLADERQHYLDFFEQSSEAYVVTDAEGTIVDANGAAVDVLQRRRGDLKGKSIAAMVALERRTEFRARVRKVTAREPGITGEWSTIFQAPGLRADVTVRVRPIERAGTVAGLCWLLQAAP
jgi:PAS domain S-box-containing protein